MHPSNDISDQPLPSFEEYPPAFWEDARMWCLLEGRPWVQLGGSRGCGALYLRHLRNENPGEEEKGALKALVILNEHVRQERPESLGGELAQALRNYTVALFVHTTAGRESLAHIQEDRGVPADIANRVAGLQRRVLEHLQTHELGSLNDLWAWTAWTRSPTCWEELAK